MKQDGNNFHLTTESVKKTVAEHSYLIPQPADLQSRLPDGIVFMQAESNAESRVTVEDPEAFMQFVRKEPDIKAVMYSFRFYDEQDLEHLLKLTEADKIMFADDRSRNDYYRYTEIVSSAVDLARHPKHASFYVLHGHTLITCTIDDPWLQQLSLPNAQTLRELYQKSGSYSGGGLLQFRLDAQPPAPDEPAHTPKPAPAEKTDKSAKTKKPAEHAQPAQNNADSTKQSGYSKKKSRKKRNKGK